MYQTITVDKLSPAVGAEIGGVDIARGSSDQQFAEIRQAFIDNGVIFFRDQDLTPDQHIAFAERWGEININRFFKSVDTHPQIAEVRKEPDQKQNIGVNWHTDHSYDEIPAMGSILYAREVPAVGGDTLFAGMAAAYEALSDGMKPTLRGLRAEHSSRHAFGQLADVDPESTDIVGRLGNPAAATQDATHPVVIEHPLSGRPSLYVNGDFTLRFEGWTDEESKPLLEFLYRHAVTPAFTCRFRWTEGALAMWDNRAVQHCALNDYHGQRRLMHRITIEGEKINAGMSVHERTVRYELTDGIATITLDRPQSLNSMNDALMLDLNHALETVVADPSVRVMVLTGAGRGFCSGADLSTVGNGEDDALGGQDDIDLGQSAAQGMDDVFHPPIRLLSTLPVPTIAKVNGVAAGGGLGLALGCDIAIAARSARFVCTFGPRLGIVPDLGTTFHLAHRVGAARARGIAMLGQPIGAEQAENWGLIWSVVDDDQLDPAVAEMAASLARSSPDAMSRIRDSLNTAVGNTLSQQLDVERDHQRVLIPRNMTEGAAVFIAKREPHFDGARRSG